MEKPILYVLVIGCVNHLIPSALGPWLSCYQAVSFIMAGMALELNARIPCDALVGHLCLICVCLPCLATVAPKHSCTHASHAPMRSMRMTVRRSGAFSVCRLGRAALRIAGELYFLLLFSSALFPRLRVGNPHSVPPSVTVLNTGSPPEWMPLCLAPM